MRCPFCNAEDTQVKDSRPSEDGLSIRRRRSCNECNSRFTTFERLQLRDIYVFKKSGERRPFDRNKITSSILLATRKRPVTSEQIEDVVNKIVREIEGMGELELSSSSIGEMVMTALAKLDNVAYVRFASVYKDFREAKDFGEFIQSLDIKTHNS
jgi:transcriptional repressor NrdR